jgi:hypothetical protein
MVDFRNCDGQACTELIFQAEEAPTVIILKRPDTANWMGEMDNETPLGDLCIPGTHESCALYGGEWTLCICATTMCKEAFEVI